MKLLRSFITAILTITFVAAPFAGLAADAKADKKDAKPKPYPLKTCVVSDEKFGGDMGEPYVFVHEGQEIKLCCKPCLKDFKKNTAKYMKKIAQGEKKPAK